jgi:hypothetical protein
VYLVSLRLQTLQKEAEQKREDEAYDSPRGKKSAGVRRLSVEEDDEDATERSRFATTPSRRTQAPVNLGSPLGSSVKSGRPDTSIVTEGGEAPPSPSLSIMCDGFRCFNVHWMICFGTSMCTLVIGLLLFMLAGISSPSLASTTSKNDISGGWSFLNVCMILSFIWTGIGCCGCLCTYGRPASKIDSVSSKFGCAGCLEAGGTGLRSCVENCAKCEGCAVAAGGSDSDLSVPVCNCDGSFFPSCGGVWVRIPLYVCAHVQALEFLLSFRMLTLDLPDITVPLCNNRRTSNHFSDEFFKITFRCKSHI